MFSVKIDVKDTITSSVYDVPSFNGNNALDGETNLKDFFRFSRYQHIRIAKEVKAEEDRSYPQMKTATRFVDGVAGRVEEKVKTFGKISYISKAVGGLGKALLEIYTAILTESKIGLTSNYLTSHVVFYGTKFVAGNIFGLKSWIESPEFQKVKVTDYIRFVNLMPYARRLEFLGARVGGTVIRERTRRKRRKGLLYARETSEGQKVRQPSGTYYVSSRKAQRLLAGSGVARFEFVSGDVVGLSTTPYKSRVGAPYRVRFKGWDKRLYLYPAIVIGVTEGINEIFS